MSPVCRGAEFRRDRAQRWEEAGLQLHTGDVIRGGPPRDQGRGCRQGTGRAPHAAPRPSGEAGATGVSGELELQSAGGKGRERAALLGAASWPRSPATLASGAKLKTGSWGPGIQHLLSGETDHLEGLDSRCLTETGRTFAAKKHRKAGRQLGHEIRSFAVVLAVVLRRESYLPV